MEAISKIFVLIGLGNQAITPWLSLVVSVFIIVVFLLAFSFMLCFNTAKPKFIKYFFYVCAFMGVTLWLTIPV